jgi:hypothetical protein
LRAKIICPESNQFNKNTRAEQASIAYQLCEKKRGQHKCCNAMPCCNSKYLRSTAEFNSGFRGRDTELDVFHQEGHEYGIVGCAVGAAFAVLIAEELFASGCRLLVSVTSAGQILPVKAPPYFIVINRALRDEGTSYHYLLPSDYSAADAHLAQLAQNALIAAGVSVQVGATWTTDAPFRETQEATNAGRRHSCGRDGSRSAIRLCKSTRPICALLRACD